MKLLVIRHGVAGNAKEFAKTGADDELRPLTADGAERMRLAAAGLHRVVDELDVLATSPLVRARQTADIVAREYGGPEPVEVDALRPDSELVALSDWLQGAGANEIVAVVGHDTHLSELVSWLLTGRERPIINIKKGAAVMLKLRDGSRHRRGARSGRLLWSLTPKQLRRLSSEPRDTPCAEHSAR